MASQLAASPVATVSSTTPVERFISLLVRRRVSISALLFTALIGLDVFVFRTRPRNLLNPADPFVLVAVMLIYWGLAVRSWAAGTLRKQRELATTGPYALIRHPLYFGSFLMMVGFGMLIQDPITLWIVAGPVAWLYWQAVKSEERQMAKLFPAQWPGYSAAVPRFVPRYLSWPRLRDWSLAQWIRNSEYQALFGSALAVVGIKLWQMWL